MKFIDLHCDTAGRIFYENLHLNKSICKVDIEKLKKGKCLGQVFAIFVDQKLNFRTAGSHPTTSYHLKMERLFAKQQYVQRWL